MGQDRRTFDRERFDEYLLDHGCVGFFDPPITLKSGRPGHYYINVRNVLGTVGQTRKTARFVYFFATGMDLRPDYFIGVPEGATPLGEEVNRQIIYSDRDEIPSVILRAVPKDHGDPSDRYSVGKLVPGSHAVLVEDVTTTGGSVFERVKQLQKADVLLDQVIAVGNRLEITDEGDRRSVAQVLGEDFGVSYSSLTDASTLVPKAYERLNPPDHVARAVEEYFKRYGTVTLKLL